MLGKPDQVPVRDIRFHPEMTPPRDEVFAYLFNEVLCGRVPLYAASVPVRLVEPYSADFQPKHPAWVAYVNHLAREWAAGRSPQVLLYPRQDVFVLSDDYPVLAAARLAHADVMQAFVMGNPTALGVTAVRGPLSTDDVKRALGLS